MPARSSMDAIWDDELARATQWLSSKKRQREQQERSIFVRVNNHLYFLDVQLRDREQAAADALLQGRDAHAHGTSSAHGESLPEPDLALDFLGGVSADDIKSLLEAEAAQAASDALVVPSVPTFVSPAPAPAPAPEAPTSPAMAPLAMPTHLLSKSSPPKLYASTAKHTHLTPKFVVSSASAAAATTPKPKKSIAVTALPSIALDEDAGVAELMNELELDMSDLSSVPQRQLDTDAAAEEEHKSEESTPPQTQTGRAHADDRSGMSALARSVFGAAATPRSPVVASRMKTLSERAASGDAASANATGAVDLDQVAAEMHGWVTGYRDPEVIRRKETMSQRSRRQTARFGVASAEEQRAILKAAKYYAGEDDSASASDASYESDFSPVDDADDVLDDPLSDTELLSDDYLDESSVESHGKTQRRRQRKASSRAARGDATKKKKKSSRTRASGNDAGAAVSTGVKATATFYVTASSSNSNSSSSKSESTDPRAHEPSASAPAPPAAVPVPKSMAKPVASDSPATPSKRAGASGKSSSAGPATAAIELLSSDDDASKRPATQLTSAASEQQQRASGHDQPQQTEPARLNAKTPATESSPARLKVVAKRLDASATSGSATTATPTDSRPVARAASPDKSVAKKKTTRNRINDDDDDEGADDSLPGGAAAALYDAADFEPASVGETQMDESLEDLALSRSALSQAPLAEPTTAPAIAVATPTPVASSPAAQVLSEAALTAHNAQHAGTASKPVGPTDAAANGDAASEAETLDFDDIEEDESDHADLEIDTTRQDDLGFSDASESEAPVVAAPNDDVYEQFFDNTPLRKEKLQQREQKPAAAAAVASSAKTPAAPQASNGSATGERKAGTDSVKTNSTRVAASTLAMTTTTEVTGSNGLRKKVRVGAAIATTTVLKGKYQHSRRSIQVIADDRSARSAGKRSITGVYSASTAAAAASSNGTSARVKKSRYSEPLVQPQERPHQHLSSELTLELMSSLSEPDRSRTTTSDERYLSYRNSSSKPQSLDSDDEPLAASVRTPKATNENVDANPKTPVYARDRQMDIYDALHIDGSSESGLTKRDLRDGEYKRPSAFKKVQEEREKRGITFVPREKFLENQPIPKKKKLPAPAKASVVDDYKSSSTNVSRSDKWSSPAKPGRSEKPSHYGPSSSTSDPLPASSKSANDHKSYSKSSSSSGSHAKHNGKKFDRFKPRRSLSPVPSSRRRSHESESYRSRRHGRSRSPSPRYKDRYKRYRSPSRSRSRSRDRSHARKDYRDDKATSSDRSHDESSRKRSRSKSPAPATEVDSYRDAPKRLKPEDPRLKARESGASSAQPVPAPPPAGALFDDDFGSDMYISDSDNELESTSDGAAPKKKPVDIRVDLTSVAVDARLIRRRVYVSGINGVTDEEVLEELFAPFGLETDRTTGFPAIDVYLCQRSLRPRGDACVTFVEEAGARRAVEELNAKIVKNCQIQVRAMDAMTQRVLTAQFEVPRESWKCASADCRADVSIWNNKCTACSRKRVFGQSRVRIADTDWLCSICYTANADRSTACHSCNAALPPMNRAQFYAS